MVVFCIQNWGSLELKNMDMINRIAKIFFIMKEKGIQHYVVKNAKVFTEKILITD